MEAEPLSESFWPRRDHFGFGGRPKTSRQLVRTSTIATIISLGPSPNSPLSSSGVTHNSQTHSRDELGWFVFRRKSERACRKNSQVYSLYPLAVSRAPRERARKKLALIHHEDNFAELFAGFEVLVCETALGERESAIDNRLQPAGGDEFEYRGEFGLGAHVGAEDGELAAEEEAQIDFAVVASGGSAGDQATAAGEAGYAVVPRGGSDVLEDYIHAALPCQAADFAFAFFRFCVD